MKYTTKLIGKIRYEDNNLWKFSYDKSIKYFCEHCRERKGKVSYATVNTSVKNAEPGDGIGWCKECTYSFDVGEETPKKNFKKEQKLYYMGGFRGENKVYCEFLYATSDDYAVVEVTQEDESKVKLDLKFDELFSDENP